MICCCNTHLPTFSGKICDMLNAFVLHQGSVKFVCSLTQLSSYYVIVFFFYLSNFISIVKNIHLTVKNTQKTRCMLFSPFMTKEICQRKILP